MIKSFLFISIFSSFCIFGEIPIVDLDNDQEVIVTEVGEALNTYGFVIIKNHHISQDLIDAAYDSAKHFFSLPIETKNLYQGVELNRGYKGYDPNRKDKKSDLQEYWHVGNLGTPWPEEVDSFKENLSNLYREIAECGQPILEACSLYMGLDKEFLSDLTREGDSIMRVIHYLPSSQETTTWKAPHRDPNLLTMIVGISKSGLELQTREGEWIAVPYVPNAIVVSASNMLESLSNGLIRSAPHRVVISESATSRYAIPFFFHVQSDLSIGPQSICVAKTGEKPLYPEQTAGVALKDHAWFNKYA